MPGDDRLPFLRSMLPDDVGTKLRTAREGAGLERRVVAAAAGIAPRTLARIERGAQKPTWPSLEGICEALGLSTFQVARRWSSDALDVPGPEAAPGVAVRAIRLARGRTLVDVAEEAGVSVATLSRFERGLTASRLLADRPAVPGVAFHDRDVSIDSDPLARALGFADAAELRLTCRAISEAVRTATTD